MAATNRNSLIYNGDRTGIYTFNTGASPTLYPAVTVDNTTIYNIAGADETAATGILADDGVITARNTISAGNANYDWNIGVDGTFAAGSNYNIDSDTPSLGGNAPGANSVADAVPSNIFTSLTGGSENLHLKAGSPGIDAGTNLSGQFTIDISGATRTGTWDIGAYQNP